MFANNHSVVMKGNKNSNLFIKFGYKTLYKVYIINQRIGFQTLYIIIRTLYVLLLTRFDCNLLRNGKLQHRHRHPPGSDLKEGMILVECFDFESQFLGHNFDQTFQGNCQEVLAYESECLPAQRPSRKLWI